MKKLIILFVCLIGVILLPTVDVDAKRGRPTRKNRISEVAVNRSYTSIEINRRVLNQINLQKNRISNSPVSRDYAGTYINQDGNLVYATTRLATRNKLISEIGNLYRNNKIPIEGAGDASIVYEVKKYTYDELEQIKDFLAERSVDYDIVSMGIIQSDNVVLIKLTSNKVNEILSLLANNFDNFEEEMVSFDLSEATSSLELNYYAYGGHYLRTYGGFLNLFATTCTVGFNGFLKNTNTYGVVTSAHCAPFGKSFYNQEGKYIGDTHSRVFYGSVDAAFIPFNSTPTVTWHSSPLVYYQNGNVSGYYTMDRYLPSYNIIEGMLVYKTGYATLTTQGKIKSTNFSWYVQGVQFNNLLAYSCSSAAGDSGAPMFSYHARKPVLLGIHMGSEYYGGEICAVGVKAQYIVERLGVVPHTTIIY